MAIVQRLRDIAGAIRVKQGYDADDFENHPIAFTDFASAIAGIQQGGNLEDSVKAYISNNQTKASLNIEITTTCTEVVS